MDALDLLLSKSGWDGVLRPQAVEKAVSALLDADDEVSAILNKADDTVDDPDDLTDRLISIMESDMADYAASAEGDLVMASQAAARDALAQLEITDTDLIDAANNVAADWARNRAAELVGMRLLDDGTMIQNPDAKWAITDTTRDRIRDLVTRAFEDETPIDELADDIQNAGAFSDSRAEMIARTETIRAEAMGNLTGWQQSGLVSGVEWTCSADHNDASDCNCSDNEAGSPYSIDAVPDYPDHPNEMCSLRAVVVPKEDLEEAVRSRFTKVWNEDQPRVPAGTREGGEFAPGGAGEFSFGPSEGPRQGRFSFISRPKVPTSSEAPSGGSTPDTYKGPVYPFTPRLLDKMREAVKGKTEIDTYAKTINYGSRVVPAEIKSVESATRKIAGEYEGNPERITDLARNTIVCKPGTEENVLTDVLKKYPDAIVKRKDPSSDPLGFSGLLVKVKTISDGPAEIQINTPAMAYAKGPKNVVALFCTPKEINQLQKVSECCHGEEIYQKWRVLPPEAIAQKEELAQTSKTYYHAFRHFENAEMNKMAKATGFPLFDAYGAGVPYYIDDPFESVAFRSDGGRDTFKKFYGQPEHPIPYTDAMYKEAILSGEKITKEEYDRL